MSPRGPAWLSWRAFLLICMHAAGANAADPLPYLQYFAQGSEVPLATAHDLLASLRECRRHFPGNCGEAELQRDRGPTIADIAPLLDLGSLYAGVRASEPVPPADTLAEWATNSQALGDRLEEEVDAYDRQMIIRAVALHLACGEDPESVPMIYYMHRLDLQRFHQPPLDEAQFLAAVRPMDREARRQADDIKAQWTHPACRRAVELSRPLIRSYYEKVRQLNQEDWKPVGKREHRNLLVEHLFAVLFTLACEHEKAVCDRIDAYNAKAARTGATTK